jgi:hypothetical protein
LNLIAQELKKFVNQVCGQLEHLQSADVSLKKSPEKWSKKEILGHLIDSAANNHQRFVRAGYNAAMAFPPYEQNEWVRIQRYDEADWMGLVNLWTAYNRHLCHILEHLPPEAISALCNIGQAEPAELQFVIKDYLRHLRHHLGQILEKEV